MRVLITGACGFVGRTLAETLLASVENLDLIGLDNLSRPGSEINRAPLIRQGMRLVHGDIRMPSDLGAIGAVDWVIDAAANPSVLAGVAGPTSSRQLIEHNLAGTVNLLEYCKEQQSGFIMISTSRVYSAKCLSGLEMEAEGDAYRPQLGNMVPEGLSANGVSENFSTEPPLSLYGASKLASEILALEYGNAFSLPVYIERCGVLAGAGQFGKADQGIVSFWIHSYRNGRPLKYIGFGGQGHQVRDCLHPRDLTKLLVRQMDSSGEHAGKIINVSGGITHSFSLAGLSRWCGQRFGTREIIADPVTRTYDIPWLVLDSSRAAEIWGWQPETSLEEILVEIAAHAEREPDWLEITRDK